MAKDSVVRDLAIAVLSADVGGTAFASVLKPIAKILVVISNHGFILTSLEAALAPPAQYSLQTSH